MKTIVVKSSSYSTRESSSLSNADAIVCSVISYSFTNPVIENSKYDFTIEETEKFLTVKEPVENDTFFIMYINWLNFRRSGFHQNLEVANKIRTNIINTLKERSIVLYGAGAFIQYDLNNRDKLIENIC